MPPRSALPLAACLVLAAGTARADDLPFQFRNETGLVVSEVYVSPAGAEAWQDNVLDAPVGPGDSGRALVEGASELCDYDVRTVFETGAAIVDTHVDLCRAGSYEVGP